MVTLGETNCQSFETAATRVFTTESLTFYPERYHAPYDGREGDAGGGGAEMKRAMERRHRGRETERVFVNADKYTCLAIFNMAMVHTSL